MNWSRRALSSLWVIMVFLTGCVSAIPLSGDPPQDTGFLSDIHGEGLLPVDSVSFEAAPFDDLPEALKARGSVQAGEPNGRSAYLYGNRLYLMDWTGAASPNRVERIPMDNGSVMWIVQMADAIPHPYAAKLDLPDADKWWPVLFRDENGNDLGFTRILAVTNDNVRAGETAFFHMYLIDLDSGCLRPESMVMPTRPAPNVLGALVQAIDISGLVGRNLDIGKISVGSVIEVDFATAPQVVDVTPLRERLLFHALANTLLEFFDRGGKVMFTINGKSLESPTGSLDLGVPFMFDDTYIRYEDALETSSIKGDTSSLENLFDELENRPDGAYAEGYSVRIGDAFREDSALFTKALALRSEGEMAELASFLAYNCGYFQLKECREEFRSSLLHTPMTRSEALAASTLLAALEDARLR